MLSPWADMKSRFQMINERVHFIQERPEERVQRYGQNTVPNYDVLRPWVENTQSDQEGTVTVEEPECYRMER